MEFRCTACGNIFDDALGVCPACGSAVNREASFNFVDQIGIDYTENTAANAGQPQKEPDYTEAAGFGAQGNAQNTQNTQTPPSYQYTSYNYTAGQNPQGGYQQPGVMYNTSYTTAGMNEKSKLAAGLLGIFLGTFGIHNFYLGYTGKGVAQLLITFLSCGVFSPVSAVWGLIEGILILTGAIDHDASGRKLGE